jgi:pimeloyl-ACP methyl ester carboxylesterase
MDNMTQRSFLTDDGIILSVSSLGDGPPFVFQHGLCGSANQTASVFPGDCRFRMWTLEARGHGQSEVGEHSSFSLAQFSKDLAQFIRNEFDDRIILGGISMGCALSLHVAVNYPELVSGLILARPAWTVTAGPPNLMPNMNVGQLLKKFPASQAYHEFQNSELARLLAEKSPDNLQSLSSFFARQPSEVTAALLSQISICDPGVREKDLENLNTPTLVMGHAQDYIHPLSMAHYLAKTIPDAEFVELTPKSVSIESYTQDFKLAIKNYLEKSYHEQHVT